MIPTSLPDVDDRHAYPELTDLATLAAALALAREAILRVYPEAPELLCPRLYAADVLLHHLAGLEGALAHYRAALADNRSLLHLF